MNMQGYSLLGYINAVKQRSGKTMLVEGPTDSVLVNRVKHKILQEGIFTKNGAVDGAAMLQDSSDPALHGKGNKAKILALLNLAANDPRVQAALANKLGTITDREWDGIVVGREFLDPWTPPTQSPPHFKTVGHSMENYFFTSDAFKAWLLQSFAEHVSHEFLLEVENRFVAMLALASTWSIGIRDVSAIQKATGLINRDVLNWNNGSYEFNASVNAKLAQRQITVPANFITKINSEAKSYAATHNANVPGVWLCHGHLGEEILWSCIAHLAGEMQVSPGALQAIERGNLELRFRSLVDFLTREKLGDADPLRDAVQWLCT
jgi:hypothetical protein